MPRPKLNILRVIGTVVDEGQKVVWPSREIVIRHTAMVILSVGIATLIFASIDFGLQKLVVLAIKK